MGYNPLTVLPFSTLLKTHFGCTLYIPPILLKAYRRLWDNLPPCWASEKYAASQRLPLCQHITQHTTRGARRKLHFFQRNPITQKWGIFEVDLTLTAGPSSSR